MNDYLHETVDDWLTKQLFNAAKAGQTGLVRSLIYRGADMGSKNRLGETPLHVAAENGHRDCVELLIQAGADVHAQDNRTLTPLHSAARSGHHKQSYDIVKALLAAGADPNARANGGYQPIHWAAQHGHTEIACTLVDAGSLTGELSAGNFTPAHLAAAQCDSVTLNALLRHSPDVNIRNQNGHDPLRIVIDRCLMDGNAEANACVASLLDHGARVAAEHIENAIKLWRHEILQLLIPHMPDLTFKSALLSTNTIQLKTKIDTLDKFLDMGLNPNTLVHDIWTMDLTRAVARDPRTAAAPYVLAGCADQGS